MQGVKIRNELFSPRNLQCVTVNNFGPNSDHKSFINSVQNVRNTLGSLERSIGKSKEYEQKLLQCRGSHSHSHGGNEWWDSDHSEEKSFKCNTTTTSNSKSSETNEEYTDTWSTMSIVCLQYQYEELAKRYQILVQAYEDQCNAVGLCDKRLDQWRERANSTQAHLTHAHKTLIAVGEKYLALKNKCNLKKAWYKEQLAAMKQSLHDMMEATTRARMKFDARLEYCMANEHDADAALLLYEIRRCNLLFLENMRLKAIIEELVPGAVNWKT
uniref:SFRICE_010628 n=1 Tax=Spodoptera frugiperda TaxID=7108 RepID=A0A2H1VRF8_SPOFR